jgi:hypothetical protein
MPVSIADEVISADDIELLKVGDFTDSEEWEISSTSAFSSNIADYSTGMIADNELSITHIRPDNFGTHTAWAGYSPTNNNNTLGAPDSSYSWSRGPAITMNNYDFSSFSTFEIENVSVVLHISIPEELNQDEVNVLLQNHGTDKLIIGFTNVDTSGGLNRMNNPIIISIDGEVDWTWDKIEDTQFTVDYVSDNIGADDSEVRVDAVGIRVTYHQPWYSFENVKVETIVSENEIPIIDFGPYSGLNENLLHATCGLERADSMKYGIWYIENIVAPPMQEIGRIHTYGDGEFNISYRQHSEPYQSIMEGELIPSDITKIDLKVIIHDGCIEKIRVDINDPKLIVKGHITGNVDGLSDPSQILFAIDNELVYSVPIELGNFSFSVPIGYAFPETGDFEVGVAARFQWSSDGTEETSVIHITSMSIKGGFEIEWDYDPECMQLDDIEIDEDGGGLIIPISSRCEDDLTAQNELTLAVISMDEELASVSSSGGDLRIQPSENGYGEVEIQISVIDERGNTWNDSFNMEINSIPDPPILRGLPLTAYVELGEEEIINLTIYDVDTQVLSLSTSRSWATFDAQRNLILNPVQSGTHAVEIVINDGQFEIKQVIDVVVTAKPDLRLDNIEVTEGGVATMKINQGDVVQIISYIRNTGRGIAQEVKVQCKVDEILVGYDVIESIAPGALGIATCDTQIDSISNNLEVRVEVDSTLEIQEINEDNNIMIIEIMVTEKGTTGGSYTDRGPTIIIASIGVIIISLAALQIGPKRIKREFGRQK